jgi:hypothetical protein
MSMSENFVDFMEKVRSGESNYQRSLLQSDRKILCAVLHYLWLKSLVAALPR